MESLKRAVVDQRWMLCTLAGFLCYALLSSRYSTVPPPIPRSLPFVTTSEAFVASSPGRSVAWSPWPSAEEKEFAAPRYPAAMSPEPAGAVNSNVTPAPWAWRPVYNVPPLAQHVGVDVTKLSPSTIESKFTALVQSTAPAPEISPRGIMVMPPNEGERGRPREHECDIFDGTWVYDPKNYPLYRAKRCPFLSDQVSCQRNGRPDSGYERWRWQPHGCKLPSFNGSHVLETWRGKRVAIVGDSLNRNMWESLACLLYSSVPPRRATVNFRAPHFKIFRAIDYDCSVEFYWSPFLVQLKQSDPEKPNEQRSNVLRLDKISPLARRWHGADVMVFNTGHWWTHRGKMRAWDYFERRGQLVEDMDANEAFGRALKVWSRWVDKNVDTRKTAVFFRSVSPEHKKENLHWCYNQSRPITNETYLQWFPRSMVSLVEETIQNMRTPVKYLNVTRLSEFRRDAHTGIYTSRRGKLLTPEQRKYPEQHADCSHWCLPGLPDTWNLLLLASIAGVPSVVS